MRAKVLIILNSSPSSLGLDCIQFVNSCCLPLTPTGSWAAVCNPASPLPSQVILGPTSHEKPRTYSGYDNHLSASPLF